MNQTWVDDHTLQALGFAVDPGRLMPGANGTKGCFIPEDALYRAVAHQKAAQDKMMRPGVAAAAPPPRQPTVAERVARAEAEVAAEAEAHERMTKRLATDPKGIL